MARGTSLIPDFNDVAEANDERFSLMLSSDYNAMVEHEVHHRGQIYLMLNMLEVSTPPLYGLTSEEVRARSA